MKVYSLYVMLEDGTCLFSSNFSPMPDEALISAMIAAMQSFIKEVSGHFAKKLATGGFVFHIEKIGRISLVLASSEDERPVEQITQLRTVFIHKFGHLLNEFRGITNEFQPFENDVREILKIESISERVDPKKQLNSFALIQIPPRLQSIARELVMMKETTAVELKKAVEQPELLTRMQLEELFEEGFVGRYHNGKDFVYFV